MLHTFETTSTYTARRSRRDLLVQEWERTSKRNVYDEDDNVVVTIKAAAGATATEGEEESTSTLTSIEEGHKKSSLDYARQLVKEESMLTSRSSSNRCSYDDDDDTHSLHTIGTHSDGSQPNLYDFANLEPSSTYNPRHGSGILRFFTCWTDNIHLSRRAYLMIASILIALAVIIGASVGAANNNKKHTDQPNSVVDHNPTIDDAPDDRNRGDASFAHSLVSDLLMRHDILPDKSVFENVGSPQRLAVDYLLGSTLSTTKLHKDHMHLADWKTNQVLRNLVELYTLAVLYFTSHQDSSSSSWLTDTNWLDPELENPCTWFGITCGEVVIVAQAEMTESTSNNNNNSSVVQGQKEVRIRGVTHIALPNNHLTGSLPMEIQFLRGLLELDLSDNDLRGALPQVLPAGLKILNLSRNRFDNPIPPVWALPELQVLDLHENELRGVVPWGGVGGNDLSHWQSVREVNLEHNFLTGALPSSDQLPVVEKLVLNINRFAGYLGPDLGNFRHLEELSVRDNRLRGSLPSTLDRLTNLQVLNVGENILGGTLEVCAQLSSLQELHVFQNKFNGALPSTTWKSTLTLTTLVASRNELTGTLPDQLGDLTKLVTLHLDFNKLTGTIPSTLDNLGELQVLKLSDNNLEGEIPAGLSSRLDALHVDSNIGI
mmetsp:Transcript_11738/g.19508  ORF Transcript_11738/g.19508 Transcript_11738/m.19508 type:complete len:659 (+) Transcript_11738:311-2287(+)